MVKWNDIKKEIKSIPEEEKKAVEILAELELDYDEEKIEKIADYLRKSEQEIKELRSLSLWSIRRVHKIHKDFAYNEYEKITGEKPERL